MAGFLGAADVDPPAERCDELGDDVDHEDDGGDDGVGHDDAGGGAHDLQTQAVVDDAQSHQAAAPEDMEVGHDAAALVGDEVPVVHVPEEGMDGQGGHDDGAEDGVVLGFVLEELLF